MTQALVGSKFIVQVEINETLWSIKQHHEKKSFSTYRKSLIKKRIYFFQNRPNDISICAILFSIETRSFQPLNVSTSVANW